jgi:hypothetical protein
MGLPHLLGDAAQRVQIALERSEALLHQPGAVFVRMLDKDFNPLKVPEIEGVLEHLESKTTWKKKLLRLEGRDGEYWATLDHDRPGRYEFRVTHPEGKKETTTFTFEVKLPPRHELEEAGMAETPLRQAATISGGRFYREEDLYRMPDQVQPRSATYAWREDLDLFPLLLILFVLAITAEWVLRKLSDLS